MKKLTITLSDTQKILLAVPDDAEINYGPVKESPAKSSGGGGNPQEKKQNQEPPSDDIRKKLYRELKDYCGGDRQKMEEVMVPITKYKDASKTVDDIPKLSDGRAGVALKKLREMGASGQKAPAKNQQPAQDDDDYPF